MCDLIIPTWVIGCNTLGQNAFKMNKPRKTQKNNNNENEDEGLIMPEIYFTLAFSCDKDPDWVLERVRGEWAKIGGKKLYIKEIASFSTRMVVTFFHLWIDKTFSTILEKAKLIYQEAKEFAEREDKENSSQFVWEEILEMGIRKKCQKL